MLEALEASAVASFLRRSLWAYPLLNAAHLLGVALLVGAILLADLRLLGRLRALTPEAVGDVLVPCAGLGLALATATGALLFTVQALDYTANPAFLAKLALLGLAMLNLAWVHRTGALANFVQQGETTAALRGAALVSLIAWPLVLLAGRVTGYL